MPDTRRINMRKIRDVLRLKLEARISHEQTAAALDISKGVITKYLTLATAAGLDWPQVQALDDTALHNRLLGTPQRVSGFVQPDYGRIHQELRRKGMTLMLLWEEPRARLPGLSGPAGPGQALQQAPTGSGVRGGAGPGHHQQHPCARHPDQWPRPGGAQHHAGVDQPGACPCARPWLLPMKPNQ